jgi:tyrosine-protein kinase Etk/Wzc
MPLDRVIANDVLADLSVIPAGQVPVNPQELLAGPRFRGLVNQLLREFDLTIFDTPPANTCSDAQRVATVAGYALLVARQDHSYVSDVSTLVKLLRADGAVVIGSVLNDY